MVCNEKRPSRDCPLARGCAARVSVGGAPGPAWFASCPPGTRQPATSSAVAARAIVVRRIERSMVSRIADSFIPIPVVVHTPPPTYDGRRCYSTLVLFERLQRTPRGAPTHGEDQGQKPGRRARRRRDDTDHLEADPRAADPAVPRGGAGTL